MTSTRQKVLEYLHSHHQATAPEISQALSMTRENIRYHLNELQAAGLIEAAATPASKKRGRGRPVIVYRPADTQRPNNVFQLANLLLDELLAQVDTTGQPVQRLAARLADGGAIPKNLTQRLNRAVQHLNPKRYQARWEARPHGPLIIFRNCPYAALLPDHPQLCQVDAALLEQMLGQSVEQTARIDPHTGNPPACLFVLRQQSAKGQD